MSDLITSVRDGLDVFFAPGPELIEVRILKTPKKTLSGYFESLDLAAAAVEDAVHRYSTTSAAFYATMNSVTRAVHARALNRLKPYADCTTVDADIQRRHYFLIDFDPKRPKGVSSTDAELAEALRVRDVVMTWLTAEGGWPGGLRAMSGNGGHANYLVDLPNDDATRDLFKACLVVLHQRFATPAVDIDRAVYNAARICKIYGTVARKGDATPERPHRRAEIEERPILTAVTREQLEWLAAQGTDARPRREPTTARTRPPDVGNLRAEFDARGWYLGELHNGWDAVRCPWIDEHSGASGISETAIHEPKPGGNGWGFKCQHASCAGRTTRDVWEVFHPHEARTDQTGTADDTTVPSHWQRLDMADLAAWNCEPMRPLIDGLIARGNLVYIAAMTQTGKTLLGLYLAQMCLQGGRLFGKFTVTPIERLLYLVLEDPARRIQDRLLDITHEFPEALAAERGICQVAPGFTLTDEKFWTWLESRITEEKRELVFLDTYQKATPGIASYDDEKQSLILHRLADLTRRLGVTIIVLDHVRKQANGNRRGSELLTLDDIKGTGGKAQNADCVILLERSPDRQSLKLQAFSKDFDVPVRIVVNVEPRGSQEPKFTCVGDLDALGSEAKARGAATRQRILDAMMPGVWTSATTLADRIKKARSTVVEHLKALVELGTVEDNDAPSKLRRYRRTDSTDGQYTHETGGSENED